MGIANFGKQVDKWGLYGGVLGNFHALHNKSDLQYQTILKWKHAL